MKIPNVWLQSQTLGIFYEVYILLLKGFKPSDYILIIFKLPLLIDIL